MLKISPNDEALQTYQQIQLKQKKACDQVKWATFKIKDDAIVEDASEKAEKLSDQDGFDNFVKALKASGEPRYGALDYKKKVFFVSYINDNAKVMMKMKYSSVREAFKGALNGINYDIQATDEGEIAQEEFDKKVKAV